MPKTILVSGATGNQGSALIRALLKSGADFKILALTRDAKSPSAQRLQQLSSNISLVVGDLDHPDEVFTKAREVAKGGIWGVYSVQVAIQNPNEKAQGISLIDTALANNVSRFVYSSVDRGGPVLSPNNPTSIPHFRIKNEIEQHLLEKVKTSNSSNMSYTILRPVAFCENLTPDFIGKVFATSFSIYLPYDKKLQLVAASDIGRIGAQAFIHSDDSEKKEVYHNKALTIVGDEVTYHGFAKSFLEKIGRPLPMTFSVVARGLNWAMKDLGEMFDWFAKAGYGGNVEECRQLKGEKMMTFATWLTEESKFRTTS